MRNLSFLLIVVSIFINCLLPANSQCIQYSSRYTGYGLGVLMDFEKLHHLRTGLISKASTSQDKEGRNFDGCCGNYLYKTGDEYVIADLVGPGAVQRIWTTNYNAGDTINRIRIYFDGEKTPGIDENISVFFGGKLDYLPYPLVAYPEKTSGGFYCYVSLPFEKSLKIAMTTDDYYQVDYLKINPWIPLKSWKKKTDFTDEIALWKSSGQDPKKIDYEYLEFSKDLPANSETEMAFIDNGRQTIGQFFLKIPEIVFQTRISDDGRSFGNRSDFNVKINPESRNIKLVRRLDYGIANQKANVYVDGKLAGEWFVPDSNMQDRWLDSEFPLPSNLTKSKEEINISIRFKSSSHDWNEFRYWVYSDSTISDSIDVGNLASEKAHNYTCDFLIWEGTRDYQYPSADSASIDIIDSVFIKIFWDGKKEPSINAPIAMAFGGGMANPVKFQSLPAGVSDSNEFYWYFPMPFQKSARIVIENKSSYNLKNSSLRVGLYKDTVPMKNVGYFNVKYNCSNPTEPLLDHPLFTVRGTGHYVGVSLEGRDSWGGYLEGDNRFYTENARTPFSHGTGTEDYFNCGFHYKYGNFIAPLQGYTIEIGDIRAQYRWHLSDPIPFYSYADFGFEHGMENFQTPVYYSTAFYYLNDESTLLQTDELYPAVESSAKKHNYKCSGEWVKSTLSSNYGFKYINEPVAYTGIYHKSESEFKIDILAENSGVLLMRTLDYGLLNQEADVYVDGIFAGKWLNAGSNTFSRWLDDVFIISPEFSYGKKSLNIKIDAKKIPVDWSEFYYKVMVFTDSDTTTVDTSGTSFVLNKNNGLNSKLISKVYPNPCSDDFILEFFLASRSNLNISIINLEGKVLRPIEDYFDEGLNEIKLATRDLPQGIYFLMVRQGDKILIKEKIYKLKK